MSFSSFPFILVVLPATVLIHRVAAERVSARAAEVFLLLVSVALYAWAVPSHVIYLAASICFNFFVGRRIAAAQGCARDRWLHMGLAGNLLFLGAAKYSRFALSIIGGLAGRDLPVSPLLMAVGMSFYTIQQIMYLVDTHSELVPRHTWLDYAAFVGFFPYLASGPLTRAAPMMPQLQRGRTATAEDIGRGMYLFAAGLFKKVVIADPIGRLADTGFLNVSRLSGPEAWTCAIAYALQVYFDFSGYSDMAVGAARMLGFEIPINFRAPYRSTSIVEFWRRWHISLSQFITTYLYTPIMRAMGKATLVYASAATLMAMLLAGLWHGPSWTYVLFGLIHGVALVVNQVWRKRVKRHIPEPFAWALTMLVVIVGFVFFRSPSVSSALGMSRALFWNANWSGFATLRSEVRLLDLEIIGLPLLMALPLALIGRDSNEAARLFQPTGARAFGLAAAVLAAFFFMNSTVAQQFVYFAF